MERHHIDREAFRQAYKHTCDLIFNNSTLQEEEVCNPLTLAYRAEDTV
jgi:hypothetical protein